MGELTFGQLMEGMFFLISTQTRSLHASSASTKSAIFVGSKHRTMTVEAMSLDPECDRMWVSLSCLEDTSLPRWFLHIFNTQLNRKQTPLIRLPADVRNAIYQYAFYGEVIKVVSLEEQVRRLPGVARSYRNAMALPSTCRQTRAETWAMFFDLCVFDLCKCQNTFDTLLRLGEAQCKPVRSIRLNEKAIRDILDTFDELGPDKEIPVDKHHFETLRNIHLWSQLEQKKRDAFIWLIVRRLGTYKLDSSQIVLHKCVVMGEVRERLLGSPVCKH